MTDASTWTGRKGALLFLALAFVASLAMKLSVLKVGAPFVTIDDGTTYEGGFLVWFGNAPPQRMYLESWINGVASLAVFVGKVVLGRTQAGLSPDLVADAYRDYTVAPESYVTAYRLVIITMDMATAWFVYLLASLHLKRRWRGWAAALAAALYLFTYNTVWCDLVARPDASVAFFAALGLLFYYRSDFGAHRDRLWLAAVFLGVAAGLKLHASLFTVFLAIDLLRVHGWREGLRRAFPLALIAAACFAAASGSTLFDPLKYVKLRMLNVKDDQSPWIQWGEQFLVIVRGSGWIVVPLLLWGAFAAFVRPRGEKDEKWRSLLFVAVCWVVLFATIRQLRAYWMLPVLPLFYIAFLGSLERLRRPQLRGALVALVLAVGLGDTVRETMAFRAIDFGGLRSWIRENLDPADPIYIYGYEELGLPKTRACRETTRRGLERTLENDARANVRHVDRHLKNWEEESRLALFDLLGRDFEPAGGYAYYSIYGTPWETFAGIISPQDMRCLLVQRGFDPEAQGLEPGTLERDFELVAHRTGPGGGGLGLEYDVYVRKGN